MLGKNNLANGAITNTSDATATAPQILTPYSAYAAGGKIVGTMPDNGAVSAELPLNGSYAVPSGYHNGSGIVTQTVTTKAAESYTPGVSDIVIPSGIYLSGDQTIVGDANLVEDNIKEGVSLFGKTGTYAGSSGSGDVVCIELAVSMNGNVGTVTRSIPSVIDLTKDVYGLLNMFTFTGGQPYMVSSYIQKLSQTSETYFYGYYSSTAYSVQFYVLLMSDNTLQVRYNSPAQVLQEVRITLLNGTMEWK